MRSRCPGGGARRTSGFSERREPPRPSLRRRQRSHKVPPAPGAAPRSFRSVVDLASHVGRVPNLFGVPGIEMQNEFNIRKDGFNLYWWRIIELISPRPAPRSTGSTHARRCRSPSVDVAAKAGGNPDYPAVAPGHRRLGGQAWAASRRLLRRHACRVGPHVRDAASRRSVPFPGGTPRGCRMADAGAARGRPGGRYALPRPWPVEGDSRPTTCCVGTLRLENVAEISTASRQPGQRWWWDVRR